MIGARLRYLLPLLAALVTVAANRPPQVGYVDLRQILAAHPLHGVLDAYDREIAALQSTRRVAGLADPSGNAARAAVALQRDANAARQQVARIAERGQQDRAHERDAIAAAAASERAGDREINEYRTTLARATTANLRGYTDSIGERTARALDARRQQLREKELTVAFDLARRDGAKRLAFRLKLQDLHLDAARRAKLQAQLVTLDAHESAQIAAMRRADAATLDAYRHEVQREGDAATAQMASRLRSTAGANLGIRLQVLRAGSAAVLPAGVAQRVRSFASTYRFGSDASAINANLRDAQTDLGQTFARVSQADRRSASETSRQIETLKAGRATLYRSMIAQIRQDAERIARERGLRDVIVSTLRPQDSIDLTGVLRARLTRFWKA